MTHLKKISYTDVGIIIRVPFPVDKFIDACEENALVIFQVGLQ